MTPAVALTAAPTSSPVRRAVLQVALVVLLATGVLVAVAPRAEAMTATTASGFPGEVVTISIQNQATHPNAQWTITAPAGTTFDAVPRSANPPGTAPFSCPLQSPTQALCAGGPTTWAAGNRVDIDLRIGAAAVAGPTVGTTRLQGEVADLTVTVLPPPAPPMTAPTAGQVTQNRQPPIDGTARPGNSVSVTASGAPVCTVAEVAVSGSWSCAPSSELPREPIDLEATQRSPGGDVSQQTTRTFYVVDPLTIDTPTAGSRTTDTSVGVSGRGAYPGATVSVQVAGPAATGGATSTADDEGSWQATVTDLAPGDQQVTAHWTVVGQQLDAPAVALTIAPGPVTIVAPADASSSYATTVTVRGADASPGASVEVVVEDDRQTVTADDNGGWAVPTREAPPGRYAVEATQTVNSITSSPTRSSFTVNRLTAPVITAPAESATLSQRRPTVRGTGVPGAVLSMTVDGTTRTTTVDRAGRWQLAWPTALVDGSHRARASQTIDQTTSTPTGVRSFTVVVPVTPTPTPSSAPTDPATSVPPSSQPTTAPTSRPGSVTNPAAVPAPSRSSARPNPPASSTPKPKPVPKPVPKPTDTASPSATGSIPIDLRVASGPLVPGRIASFVGTLGPNASSESVTITLTGRVNRGVSYRSVTADPDGRCTVTTTEFTCTITLPPGARATLDLRMLADAANTPDLARQQLTVTTAGGAGGGAAGSADTTVAKTLTTTIVSGQPTDTEALARSITTFPGPFIVLLALYLLALAATEVERHRPTPTPGAPS